MRHQVCGRKFSRPTGHREAMMSNMLVSLLRHERIETTTPKAKEVKRAIDHFITLGKRGTLHARRQALAELKDKDMVAKLFNDVAGRNMQRQGGYARVIQTRNRYGDWAPMSFVELVERVIPPPVEKKTG